MSRPERESLESLVRSLESRRISRRAFIERALLLGLTLPTIGGILAACAPEATPTAAPTAPPGATATPVPPTATPAPAATVAPTATPAPTATAAPTAPAAPVTLEFYAWTYMTEMVQANIDRFESQNPDLKVNRTILDGMLFFDKMVTNFQAGVPMDVIYGDNTKRAQYVEAGWLTPIDGMPGLDEVKKDLFPAVREIMTYKGKMYGLPYFVFTVLAVYNEKMLSDAGVARPPVTLDELKKACLAIKEAGILDRPLMMNLAKKQSLGYGWYALVKGSGAHYFDEAFNPLFPDKDGTALQVLEWLTKAMNEWQILNPSALEQDINTIVQIVAQGQAAFCLNMDYDVTAYFDSKKSKVVGQIKHYLMPSLTEAGPHGSLTSARGYFLPASSKHPDQAWRLLYYLGAKDANGDYYTAKQWALNTGLAFGIAPLFEDPEIVKAWSEMYDLGLRKEQGKLASDTEGLLATWFTQWEEFHQEQIQAALLQQKSPREALQAAADKWNELKAEQG